MKDKPLEEEEEVSGGGDAMALKALVSPVTLDSYVKSDEVKLEGYSENGEEPEPKIEIESAPVKEMPETDDDILNKFDTDNCSANDSIAEDKLLEDLDELDSELPNGTHPVLNGDSKGDLDKTIEIKDQIMDTEDLLQIVDEKADEADSENELREATEMETDEIEDVHLSETECADHEKNADSEETADEKEPEGVEETPETAEDAQEIAEDAPDIVEDTPELVEDAPEILDDALDIEEAPEIVEDAPEIVEDIPELDEDAPEIEDVPEIEETPEIVEETAETTVDKEDGAATAAPEPDATTKPSKRALSDSEPETEPKKPKLTEVDLEIEPPPEIVEDDPRLRKISALTLFGEFMRKKPLDKLTRADLEQFCLQKMCEALFHKSEIGELRHQLGVQEQMVEMWRKEVVQLSKQARDLEIVNKKLLHGLKLRGEREKPLIPVKITRSVGLQVRSDTGKSIITPKRKVGPRGAAPQPQTIVAKPSASKTVAPASKTSQNSVNKPANKIINPKANALLSQALTNSATNSNSVSKSPIKAVTTTTAPLRVMALKQSTPKNAPLPKTATLVAPSKPADRTFIDLTDEEERRPQSLTLASPVMSTPVSAGVRLMKGANVVTASSVGSQPRIMYVYNNQLHQGVLAGDPTKPGGQKLMLKLNSNMMGSTNGVLATVPGNSLSVAGTPLRPGQSVRLAAPVTAVRGAVPAKTPLRHPAPLPPAPSTQLGIAARKAVPPRPHLTIRRSSGGIVLSWKMPYNLDHYEIIASYQLYAYQETSALPSSDMWRKVGDVKALALPMACTLTQFADGNKYHFAVRAVDVHKRMGQFSEPEQILL